MYIMEFLCALQDFFVKSVRSRRGKLSNSSFIEKILLRFIKNLLDCQMVDDG